MYIKEKTKGTVKVFQEVTEENNEILTQMNNLFVTYRGSYLMQTGEGPTASYTTIKSKKLSDYILRQHLNQYQTIGIKLGPEGLTKFMTFDVDIMDEGDRRNVTIKLVSLLNRYYGIPREDIHVWYSGSKGYHIDLYFDNMIPEKSLLSFYQEVLFGLNESVNRIERRPTTGQGVKLPLGVHKKTGDFCCYVDNVTLNPLPTEYFFEIKQINLGEFKELVLDDCKVDINLEYKESESSDEIVSSKGYGNLDSRSIESNVINILTRGHLVESSSRDKFTYYAAMILNGQGHTQEDCIKLISIVLRSTMENPETRKYLDKKWTWDSLIKETIRIVKYVYKINRRLHITKSKEVTFYKNEIDQIKKLKRKPLKRLLFSLLLHSKKYSDGNGIFYCTYSTLGKYGNDSNRGRTKKNILELEKLGCIKVVSSGVHIAKDYCAPNYYKVTLYRKNKGELSKTFSSGAYIEFKDVLRFFYPEKVGKKNLLK